jgi:hypothetical protein
MTRYQHALGALLCLMLAACGGGGGGDDADHHDNTSIDTAGRLAIAEDAQPTLRVWDLDTGAVAASITLANAPSAVYASPGGRYAMAFQRAQDTVQIVDGGVWQEDHGDHLHDYKAGPRLLDLRIDGPQPTHYDDRAGQAAIFMDGRAPAQVSSAVLVTDASIRAGRTAASVAFADAMHGFAEPNGDFLVASAKAAPADPGPTQLEVYRRNGEQFTFVQRLGALCPGMHGSYTRAGTTAVGCTDGVLLASQAGGAFTAAHVATQTGISTIAGHPRLARFVGLGNAGAPSTTRFYDIDPAAGTATAITITGWTDGRLRRAHGFDRAGRFLFVLDDAGTLYVLEAGAGGWTTRKAIAGAIPAMPAAAPFPQLAANQARDEVYLSDPVGRQLVVVNTATLDIARRTPLDFRPTYLAWLGIAR